MDGYYSCVNSQRAEPSPPALDWGLVQVFLAVRDAGSLGRAAAVLGSSQPTLSRRLAVLEGVLGQPLFERGPRGLTLTAAGAALEVPARAMRESAQLVRHAADRHARSLAGTVRITASEVVANFVLLPMLRDLRLAHPQIQIELSATDAVEDLIERRADIAIRMTRPTQPAVIARRLPDMPLGLYAHRDYVARRGEPTFETMAAHDWVGYDRDDRALRGFARAGRRVTREFFAFRCDSSRVQWQAVLAGLGIGVGLRAVGDSMPSLARVLDEASIPPLSTWLAVHRELRGTPRLRLVFDALAEGFARLG